MTKNTLPTATILYFSGIGFFRQKTLEKQRTIFDQAVTHWQNEFNEILKPEIFDQLVKYQEKERLKRKTRERLKLEKAQSLPEFGGDKSADSHIKSFPGGKYVLTAAQNNTAIDETFFYSLLQFCKQNNAKLLIARVTYNKNGFLQPEDQENTLWYDDWLKPYLIDDHVSIGQNFHFIGNANIIPTAKNPLTGFAGITAQGIHAILPASKIALKVCARLKNSPEKILASTGFCTLRNYVKRKAGTVASIEHNIGAVFIDTEKSTIRHLEQIAGFEYFYDKHMRYTCDSACTVTSHVEALQFGDIHAEKMEEKNLQNAINLMRELRPANVILHDIQDFSSRNHHNIKSCKFIHLQHVNNNTVAGDIEKMARILDQMIDSMIDYKPTFHIIESNHDLALSKWLEESDYKKDPVNAVTYLDCMLAAYRHQEIYKNDCFNMLKYAYENIGKGQYAQSNILQFHMIDESLLVAGIQMGNHGHLGTNGARGSAASFRELGEKMNTGHTHSPAINGGVYTAGVTASLDMGYNQGASSWAIGHIVTYENGQRQILFA